MSSVLEKTILADLKPAMLSRDQEWLGVIRLIMAAMKQRKLDEQIELTDEHVITMLSKMIKQRRESAESYQVDGYPELAEKEAKEIAVIQRYLPTQLSMDELNEAIDLAMVAVKASAVSDIGKVMQQLKAQFLGRIDMKIAHERARKKLGD